MWMSSAAGMGCSDVAFWTGESKGVAKGLSAGDPPGVNAGVDKLENDERAEAMLREVKKSKDEALCSSRVVVE